MKKYIYIFCMLAGVSLISCTDLTLIPEDTMAPESYFSNETELRLWTNGYYDIFPGADNLTEICADDVIRNILSDVVMGSRLPAEEGGWSWSDLRTINYYFQYCGNCSDVNARNHYDGLSHFMRAYFYFTKVQRYGDVPYYDKVVGSKDNDLLYKARDSRKYVMQKIMEDLDLAIRMLPNTKTTYEVNKWTALALKSRVGLFEGTFRKYHNLGDWEEMLQASASASRELITTGGYSLYKTGNTPYRDLFASLDARTDEVILALRYSTELSILHNAQANSMAANQRISFTKRFVDHYLMADGSRYTDIPGHETKGFADEMSGRDPRLAQTILAPGYIQMGATKESINTLSKYTLTGYQYIKYVMTANYDQSNKSPMDFPLFRLAEVYLNYAEAKAELGTLTQDDLDISVNLLRDRIKMKRMDMAAANANPDPYLLADITGYPNVTRSAMTGIILEIRRERTVELCLEGFRLWDIIRWKEGKQLTNEYHGVYFPGTGKYDLNGDGKVETAIWKDTQISGLGLTKYQLGVDFFLTNDTEGYMWPHKNVTRTWNENRDYLWPIPTKERVKNRNLTQNPGWDDGLSY